MKEEAIHQALDLAELFKMTVLQTTLNGEVERLTFFVIADSLAEAVETMNLDIQEIERAFPGTKMILLKVSTLGDGIRIAPALASDIVSQISNGNPSPLPDQTI